MLCFMKHLIYLFISDKLTHTRKKIIRFNVFHASSHVFMHLFMCFCLFILIFFSQMLWILLLALATLSPYTVCKKKAWRKVMDAITKFDLILIESKRSVSTLIEKISWMNCSVHSIYAIKLKLKIAPLVYTVLVRAKVHRECGSVMMYCRRSVLATMYYEEQNFYSQPNKFVAQFLIFEWV